MIATQIASSAKSSAQALNVLPNQEFFRRLRQLRDKIANLRRTMQLNSNQSHLYLTKLKKLNDWLSHRDAAFHEILVPIQGDMSNVISLREKLLVSYFKRMYMITFLVLLNGYRSFNVR
ncbi:unnamed protein product [Schistosoma margrebowiei]|uniref:Uncharacterized protein n=1 Tax=Schistosoma margrebowiei TaxID=48269 RepID=A0A183M2S0_9TREM|nr:unnamed protein product [Schistosoma margrebowiei]